MTDDATFASTGRINHGVVTTRWGALDAATGASAVDKVRARFDLAGALTSFVLANRQELLTL